MRPNRLRKILREGGQALGTFIGLPAAGIVEMCGDLGLDFVIVDMEHSTFSFETVESMSRAADLYGMATVVRVSEGRTKEILRALDTGAQGIMVPQVSDPDEARRIGDATRYPPEGIRGVANHSRGGGYAGSALVPHMETSNEEVICICQIETTAGVENCEAIAAAPNVDMLYVGPVDLSTGLGHPLELQNPIVAGAIDRVLEAAKKASKSTGIFFPKLEDALAARRRGIDLVTWSTDTLMFNQVLKQGIAAWRESAADK